MVREALVVLVDDQALLRAPAVSVDLVLADLVPDPVGLRLRGKHREHLDRPALRAVAGSSSIPRPKKAR